MTWQRQDNGHLAACGGRFELFASAACPLVWVCYDWDAGRTTRGDRSECEAWAAAQLRGTSGGRAAA